MKKSGRLEKNDRYIQVCWSFILVTIFVFLKWRVCLLCHLYFQSSLLAAFDFYSIWYVFPYDVYRLWLFYIVIMHSNFDWNDYLPRRTFQLVILQFLSISNRNKRSSQMIHRQLINTSQINLRLKSKKTTLAAIEVD